MPKKGIIESILASHKKADPASSRSCGTSKKELGSCRPSRSPRSPRGSGSPRLMSKAWRRFIISSPTVPAGRYAVYLNNNIVSAMKGRAEIAAAFEKEAGCRFGETTPTGSSGFTRRPASG